MVLAGQVGADGRDVPEERGREVAVQDHVEGAVRPPQVQDDASQAEEEHEDGDDLGRARDRAAPLGVRQAEDRRDERPRVADADEEDEVRDVEAPVHGHVQARDAEAPAELGGPGEDAPEPRWPGGCRRRSRSRGLVCASEQGCASSPSPASSCRSDSSTRFSFRQVGHLRTACRAPRGAGTPAGSRKAATTALRGSSRSPKTIASAGQVSTQAGT